MNCTKSLTSLWVKINSKFQTAFKKSKSIIYFCSEVKETYRKPTNFKLSEQSVINTLLSTVLCSELLNLSNPHVPHLGTLNISKLGTKCIWKHFCVCLLKNVYLMSIFFWHWKFEMLPGRNSLYQPICLAPVSPFRVLWNVQAFAWVVWSCGKT